ncbi:hypothetical protein F4824DRAFT_26958 [Ustulina deusta]|nr:hypothetical protein F4824DRAFT_26958 [Ustulina deusta]
MSGIIHKIKDAVTHHHHDDHTHDQAKEKKHASPRKSTGARPDLDLNCSRPATHAPVDITGRHVEPDDRDIDGRRHSHEQDAPDLTGPHHDRDSVDINGQHPTTHNAPDLLESPPASPSRRQK